MLFRTKITLITALLMFLSLATFGLHNYYDTRSNAVKQVESNLKTTSLALTSYVDLWVSSKKTLSLVLPIRYQTLSSLTMAK